MQIGNVTSEHTILNVYTTRLPRRVLELPHIPECCSVVQAGEDVFYPGPCVAIPQPAQLNGPPQFVAESKSFRPFRFHRSNPFQDCIGG